MIKWLKRLFCRKKRIQKKVLEKVPVKKKFKKVKNGKGKR